MANFTPEQREKYRKEKQHKFDRNAMFEECIGEADDADWIGHDAPGGRAGEHDAGYARELAGRKRDRERLAVLEGKPYYPDMGVLAARLRQEESAVALKRAATIGASKPKGASWADMFDNDESTHPSIATESLATISETFVQGCEFPYTPVWEALRHVPDGVYLQLDQENYGRFQLCWT